MAKASGSYPEDRQFESDTSYQKPQGVALFAVACGFTSFLFFINLRYIFLLCDETHLYVLYGFKDFPVENARVQEHDDDLIPHRQGGLVTIV